MPRTYPAATATQVATAVFNGGGVAGLAVAESNYHSDAILRLRRPLATSNGDGKPDLKAVEGIRE
jgi:hypothetical protein